MRADLEWNSEGKTWMCSEGQRSRWSWKNCNSSHIHIASDDTVSYCQVFPPLRDPMTLKLHDIPVQPHRTEHDDWFSMLTDYWQQTSAMWADLNCTSEGNIGMCSEGQWVSAGLEKLQQLIYHTGSDKIMNYCLVFPTYRDQMALELHAIPVKPHRTEHDDWFSIFIFTYCMALGRDAWWRQ